MKSPEIESKQRRLKSTKDLVAWFRSEDGFWEHQSSIERLCSPSGVSTLDPEGICYWCAVRAREEIRAALLETPEGYAIAKSLRVLEHPRILEIFAKAVAEQDFHASPYYVRFTLSVVATCLDACTKNPDRTFWK